MTRSITLVGVDGERIGLGQPPFYVGEAPALWGAPPITYNEVDIVGPGSELQTIRHAARDAVLPILVAADSVSQFDVEIRRLMRIINPVTGRVRIVVTNDENSTARELVAYVVSGFETISYASPGAREVVVPLRLRAPNPYWRSTTEIEIPLDGGSPQQNVGGTPYDVDLPYDINRPYNGITTYVDLINLPVRSNGDAISWPRFEINGPAALVELVNERTAQRWDFDGLLNAGQTLVVETEPGRRMIMVDGKPKFTAMGDSWQWWGLLPGINPVSAHLSDFQESTSLRVFYREQWLTA